jgi:hypothetical protein
MVDCWERLYSGAAVVDNAAKMLDEVAVDLRRDGADGLGGKDVDPPVGLGGLSQKMRAAESNGGGGEGGGLQERASCGCGQGNDIETRPGLQVISAGSVSSGVFRPPKLWV